MHERTLAIDLAKDVFQVSIFNEHGKIVGRKRLRRNKLSQFLAQQSPSTVAMEACAGSHYWGRVSKSCDHQVKLVPPQRVRPFRQGQKNDANDGDAIGEAARSPNTRLVGVKSVEQQELQAVHRWRERVKGDRQRVVNQTRAILFEFGVVIGQSFSSFSQRILEIVEDGENELTPRVREMAMEGYEEYQRLSTRLAELDREIKQIARQNEQAKRLEAELRGVGPITATALLCVMADPKAFKTGRQFSGLIGVVPRQYSSGDRIVHKGIKKGGQSYVRTLLIHGARSVISHLRDKQDPQSRWLRDLVARRGTNRAAVALANKNARQAWAILSQMV